MQLMELDVPMVLALNMMDEVRETAAPSTSTRWRPCSAFRSCRFPPRKGEGIDELVSHALHVAHYQERPSRRILRAGGAAGRRPPLSDGIMHLIEDHAEKAGIPLPLCRQQAGRGRPARARAAQPL